MNAVLPEEIAKSKCLEFASSLDNSELGKALMQKDCGRMFGILVCTDGTVYKAFSGQLFGHYHAEGFVPPCFDEEKTDTLLKEYDALIKASDSPDQKKKLSEECWKKLCCLYTFTDFRGEKIHLSDINTNVPAGTGDCCAPRLLSYCFSNAKSPLSMCEFYYGNGTKPHMSFHTPCNERCKPILKYILGLDVLYLDNDIVVINKPGGLLAIEGRTEDKKDCAASRVRKLYNSIQQPCVHRLDQATSGLMVLALTQKAHKALSKQFEEHKVIKEYRAIVKGKIIEKEGSIDLPMRLDTDNSPHQIIDFENGKQAHTTWKNLGIHKIKDGFVTELSLIPTTGRTHQLRLHCAYGLGHAIVNDSLYGDNENINGNLMLTAVKLGFVHPSTGKYIQFEL